jgi:hypothetical protein
MIDIDAPQKCSPGRDIFSIREENRALEAFETRFREHGSHTPDMQRMGVEQLDEYSVLLSNGISGLDELGSRLRRFDLESEAIRRGAPTEEEMMREAVAVPGR